MFGKDPWCPGYTIHTKTKNNLSTIIQVTFCPQLAAHPWNFHELLCHHHGTLLFRYVSKVFIMDCFDIQTNLKLWTDLKRKPSKFLKQSSRCPIIDNNVAWRKALNVIFISNVNLQIINWFGTQICHWCPYYSQMNFYIITQFCNLRWMNA